MNLGIIVTFMAPDPVVRMHEHPKLGKAVGPVVCLDLHPVKLIDCIGNLSMGFDFVDLNKLGP
jgi:hypothetical protein